MDLTKAEIARLRDFSGKTEDGSKVVANWRF